MSELSVKNASLQNIPGLLRAEQMPMDVFAGYLEKRRATINAPVELFSEICPVHAYINCPPDKVFEYMANPHSLEEWTYSVRGLKASPIANTLVGDELLASGTKIFCRTESNAAAKLVDYYCAWDQGEELWMIYLNRIVPAEPLLKKPGSIVFWQNCRHPNYKNNPYGSLVPEGRKEWVGDFWDLFHAGHLVEIENLKAILEYRHSRGLPMGPFVGPGAA